MAAPDEAEIARRVRAARLIADIRTVEELAQRIDARGLGAKTIGAIERGERDAKRMELREIAEACGLPEEFFTADLWSLAGGAGGEGTGGTPGAAVEERLAAIEGRLTQLEEGARTEELIEQTRRLVEVLTARGASG